jgi:hypothetical protein
VSIDAPAGLRIPLVISVLLLMIAILADMQFDFYVLLRIFIFVTCIAWEWINLGACPRICTVNGANAR